MSVKSEVIAISEQAADDRHKRLSPPSDDLGLLESGLHSLCFAIIVARLENRFGLDLFSAQDAGGFPLTIGDFIALYEHAAS
jgi:hypothetical protein